MAFFVSLECDICTTRYKRIFEKKKKGGEKKGRRRTVGASVAASVLAVLVLKYALNTDTEIEHNCKASNPVVPIVCGPVARRAYVYHPKTWGTKGMRTC
jgi:hypothetical protein